MNQPALFAPAGQDDWMLERDSGALFVSNHSGGKDSQAMLIHLLEHIPPAQLLVIHASLGEVEWPGALEHAQRQAEEAGLPFLVAQANRTFLEMVEQRFDARPTVVSFPDARNRTCTSSLKRDPLAREIRRYAKAHGYARVVNCMGMRASESSKRAGATPWKHNEAQSARQRIWHDLLPIHSWSKRDVLERIRAAGQQLHPAYALGNDRLSCVFCIMSSKNDLQNGAQHNPLLLERLIKLEEKTGYTLHMSRTPLRELTQHAPCHSTRTSRPH